VALRPYMVPPCLKTERLLLRPFEEGDLDAVAALEADEGVVRWLYEGPKTRDESRAGLARKIDRRAMRSEGDGVALAAVTRQAGAFVGDFSLWLASAAHEQGEMGFVVAPAQQGRGYATEAAMALLGVAFEEVGMHRVVGRLEARNRASARVLEKVGMRQEAHLVENEWVKGEWQSELVYAMLAREWRERWR
jgi:RimJ/RimL family protein N-acetyltransferase